MRATLDVSVFFASTTAKKHGRPVTSEPTGLEPATSAVTGQRSNQLS
jgi:hypothetical protein